MMCVIEGCADNARWRYLCVRHYHWAYRRGQHTSYPSMTPQRDWVNPLVCICDEPDVDGVGMCRTCYRKPAALLRLPVAAA